MKYKKIMIKTIYDIPEHIFKTSYQNATIGHVLTPPKLALEMVETLPVDFIKEGIKILDPACKNGSFLFQIVIKQLEKGLSIKEIEKSLYTVDILMASLNIAESGIKLIIRYSYWNSLVRINDLFDRFLKVELFYNKIIKTISENKYISIREFINKLLLDKKDNWVIMNFEENLIEFIKKYEGLSKTESKLFGEVFTPQALIEEILDTLPDDVWSNKDLKWLDPAVGIGNFPAAILNRLMEGLKDIIVDSDERRKWILEEMLYMGDISTKNLFLLYQLFDQNNEFKLNVFRGDFLSEKFDKHMKEVWGLDGFDLVVGNPPYQEDGATGDNKLYLKFISKILNNSNNKYLLFVTPKKVIENFISSKNRDYMSKKFNFIKLSLDTPSLYFNNIGSSFCYFLLKNYNKENNNTEIEFLSGKKRNIIYGNIYNFKKIPSFLDKITLSILNKTVFDKKDNFNLSVMVKENGNQLRIRGKQIDDKIVSDIEDDLYKYKLIDKLKSKGITSYFFTEKLKGHDSKKVLLSKGGSYTFPLFDNKGEMSASDNLLVYYTKNKLDGENFVFICNSKLVKFIENVITKGNDMDYSWTMLNLPIVKDLDIKKYSDQELYEYFNLTPEEIKLIEETIQEPTKKKKSKKK